MKKTYTLLLTLCMIVSVCALPVSAATISLDASNIEVVDALQGILKVSGVLTNDTVTENRYITVLALPHGTPVTSFAGNTLALATASADYEGKFEATFAFAQPSGTYDFYAMYEGQIFGPAVLEFKDASTAAAVIRNIANGVTAKNDIVTVIKNHGQMGVDLTRFPEGFDRTLFTHRIDANRNEIDTSTDAKLFETFYALVDKAEDEVDFVNEFNNTEDVSNYVVLMKANAVHMKNISFSAYDALSAEGKVYVQNSFKGNTFKNADEIKAVFDIAVADAPTGGTGSGPGPGHFPGGVGGGGAVITPDANDREWVETDTPSEEIEMTRASICQKIVNNFEFELADANTESPFPDVDETNEYYEAILICNQLGIVNGYVDGTFKPEASITNAEVAKLIYSTLAYIGWPVEVPEDADYDKTMWYGQYAWLAEELGIMVDVESWFDVTYDSNISFVLYRIGDVYQNNIEEILNPDLAPKKYIFEVGNTIVLRDNEEIESNYAPIIYEGNVYCNARTLAEAINAIAEYDDETKTITFYGWCNIVEYVLGEENCVVVNGRTLVNAKHFLNKMIGTRYSITSDDTYLIATKKETSGTTPEETPDETYIKVGNVTTRKGKEIVVPITISENEGLTGLQLDCSFDNILTLTNVETGAALSNLEFTKPGNLTLNNVTFLWDGMDADNSNGEILNLTFKVSDDAEVGSYNIFLTVKTACDQNLDDVNVVTKSGKVNIIEFIPGDVNKDDEVNVKDIILIRRYIAGGYGVDLLEPAANVDGNYEINVKDIILLRRFIAGGYDVELK